jgi:undecaprenyl-phosphate galactose phosphotransferase
MVIIILITTYCSQLGSSDMILTFNYAMGAIILFFQINFMLYSYHRIFSVRQHFFTMIKGFSLSAITLITIVSILAAPSDIINKYLVPATLLGATIIFILNRKLNAKFYILLYPVGLSFIVIALLEIQRNFWSLGIPHSFKFTFIALALSILSLLLCRLFLVHGVFSGLLRKQFRRQVIIVGSNQSANQFAEHVITINAPFWINGTVRIGDNEAERLMSAPSKGCLGRLQELPELVVKHDISDIVVTSHDISKRDLIAILDFCISNGLNAWFSPDLMPIIDIKMFIDDFCGKPMIRLCSQKNSWFFSKIKYASDALIALPVFVLQLPIFLTIMAAIKIESKGPVFYKAKAIGKNGGKFNMFKFRSMYVDADSAIHQKYVSKLIKGEIDVDSQQEGPLKIIDDPRVTKVGKFLRKWSIDELPQLINVLRGEMSLIGPRPCLPYEYDIYQDWHKKRTVVRPGITGLWQVTGRSEVLFEDMILLDLYYIYNSNLMMDLQILFETVFVVLQKRGAD